MNWVEKSSIEKIRRFLEISKRECHCRVLLTSENISVVRHNPVPYTLPIIPRPLPSHVVEGEHFVIVDLRRLVSGSASSSRNPVIEAASLCKGPKAHRGHPLPRVGVLVHPLLLLVREIGVAISNASSRPRKWPNLPPEW